MKREGSWSGPLTNGSGYQKHADPADTDPQQWFEHSKHNHSIFSKVALYKLLKLSNICSSNGFGTDLRTRRGQKNIFSNACRKLYNRKALGKSHALDGEHRLQSLVGSPISSMRFILTSWSSSWCDKRNLTQSAGEAHSFLTAVDTLHQIKRQCCGSGSWFLPIPDPGSKNSNKREGWKKIWCHTFLCSHKFHKLEHYFSFEVLKKKIWSNFHRIIERFTQKIVTKLSKVWVWDPGSEIRDPEKTYSGSRIQGSKRHRIPDPGSGSATLLKGQSHLVDNFFKATVSRD